MASGADKSLLDHPEVAEALKKKYEAEARQADAEAVAKTADARNISALAISNEANAEAALIDLDREKHRRELELIQNHYHHTYDFAGSVDSKSANACMGQLRAWTRLEANKPREEKSAIEIQFFSPGGSVVDGMALFDFIQGVRNAGHRVTTSSIGYAASMAGILLQAGDHRVMSRESWLLIHEVQFGASGSFGEVEDRVEWVKKIQNRVLDIFADRAKSSGAEKPMTRAALKKHWSRTDFWVSATDALKFGFVDEVRSDLVIPSKEAA